MKEIVLGARQQEAIKLNLSIRDLAILDYLNRCHMSTRRGHIERNSFIYTHIDYNLVSCDLPIYEFGEIEYCDIINKLIKQGIIEKEVYRDTNYYSITEPIYDVLYMQPDEDRY